MTPDRSRPIEWCHLDHGALEVPVIMAQGAERTVVRVIGLELGMAKSVENCSASNQ